MGTIREAVLTVGVFAALGALIVLLWLGEARAGDIVGTVRLAGEAPPADLLHLTAEHAVCGSEPRPSEALLLREAIRREARVHPLSLAVPLASILERQAEVRRIRLVLRGAEFGLSADELLDPMEQ